MQIPPVPLVLLVVSLVLFALGQDPNRRHGAWAVGALVLALVALAAGITPQHLAMLGK